MLSAKEYNPKYSMYPKAACGDSKYKINSLAFTVPSATGVPLTLINGIAQGVSEDERIGNSANIHCIQMNWAFNLPSTVGSTVFSDSVRIIVVNDKQANSPANPAGWGPASPGGGVMELTEMVSPYNFDNVDRYDIIDDFVVDIKRVAAAGTSGNFVSGGVRRTLFKTYHGNWDTRFSGTTDGLASIASNAIQVIACTQQGLISCRVVWTCWYHDY